MVIFFLMMLAGMAAITYICYKDTITAKGGVMNMFKKTPRQEAPKA
jgi:hypothetical protein